MGQLYGGCAERAQEADNHDVSLCLAEVDRAHCPVCPSSHIATEQCLSYPVPRSRRCSTLFSIHRKQDSLALASDQRKSHVYLLCKLITDITAPQGSSSSLPTPKLPLKRPTHQPNSGGSIIRKRPRRRSLQPRPRRQDVPLRKQAMTSEGVKRGTIVAYILVNIDGSACTYTDTGLTD